MVENREEMKEKILDVAIKVTQSEVSITEHNTKKQPQKDYWDVILEAANKVTPYMLGVE